MKTFHPKLKATAALAGTIVAGVFAVNQPAHAATATSNLTVTATVKPFCTIGGATLAFGDIYATGSAGSPSATDHTGDTTISVMCNRGTSGTITASNGGHHDGSIRRMLTGTSDYLSYKLYSDSGRTTELLPTSTGFTITGDGTSQTKTIYGTVPGGTNVDNAVNGSYTDTVVLTVTYGS